MRKTNNHHSKPGFYLHREDYVNWPGLMLYLYALAEIIIYEKLRKSGRFSRNTIRSYGIIITISWHYLSFSIFSQWYGFFCNWAPLVDAAGENNTLSTCNYKCITTQAETLVYLGIASILSGFGVVFSASLAGLFTLWRGLCFWICVVVSFLLDGGLGEYCDG